MNMNFIDITVHDPEGKEYPAVKAVCECGSDQFHIWQLKGSETPHPHLQCVDCGESYCDHCNARYN